MISLQLFKLGPNEFHFQFKDDNFPIIYKCDERAYGFTIKECIEQLLLDEVDPELTIQEKQTVKNILNYIGININNYV